MIQSSEPGALGKILVPERVTKWVSDREKVEPAKGFEPPTL